MKKYILKAAALSLILGLLFTGCSREASVISSDTDVVSSAVSSSIISEVTTDATEPSHTATLSYSADIDMTFSNSDVSDRVDTSTACDITISGNEVSVKGKGAAYSDGILSITEGGTYVLTGSSDDIMIYIETGDEEKVYLVLDNCTLTNSDGPVIYIRESDKVFLYSPQGTVNTLSDSSAYSEEYTAESIDGCIFSKADLTINGSGSLTIKGNYKHAVVSKDDLVISIAVLDVSSASAGLEGKDCVKITGADISITYGTDGIRSTNEEDESRGYVYIENSSIDINCGNDGIQAVTLLYASSSEISVKSGTTSASSSSDSYKGLKADLDICLKDCMVTVDTADDAIHANETVVIDGGSYTLSSEDDGIHADTDLSILEGTVSIEKSYEGLEATVIDISGGTVTINASDDGINAAGGSNTSNQFSPMFGGDHFSSGSGQLIIDSGYVYVNSSGDGLDANGSITINGGITLVSGPVNSGNGALDYDQAASINGGILIAAGSSGMAQNLSSSDNQASVLYNVGNLSAGTAISITDESGNVILSFTPEKNYQTVVFSAPSLKSGNTYRIVSGGTVSGADSYGFAQSGTISGGTEIAEIDIENNIFGGTSGFGGGGFGGKH